MVDLSRARLTPYAHQIIGVEKLVQHLFFLLADEMGAGKTKQVIDAMQVLATMGLIRRVIIVAPAAVRAVWFDPELGELAKHLWARMPCRVIEYHAIRREWDWFLNFEGVKQEPLIEWIITNYDFIRNDSRRGYLKKICNEHTALILDESSAVKNWRALQTKACEDLRQFCGRVVLLNGTPIANSPGDLYSQAHIMNPTIPFSCSLCSDGWLAR
jgi:SNF2 family DNA or RNA helicase